MEKILTSTALWQDFDATAEPLDSNLLTSVEKDGLVFRSLYFTGRSVADGKTRVFAKLCSKAGKNSKKLQEQAEEFRPAFCGLTEGSREDGFSLVCRRGELMADAAAQVEAGMVAVVKLPPQKVEELCQGFEQVYPVNYNSPAQTVVSGRADQMEPFKAAVKAAGGRALPLAVKGGFHSPFMAPAAAGLREVLSAMEIGEPRFTLYSNVTGQPYQGEMKDLLARQVENPVRWQATVEHMIASGVDTFIEVGPGKTLCGLISKIDSGVKVLNVEDAESLAKTIEEVTATC